MPGSFVTAEYIPRRALKNPKTEAKSETKRLFSTPKQREVLPDSGSHHLFNTLLEVFHHAGGVAIAVEFDIAKPRVEGHRPVLDLDTEREARHAVNTVGLAQRVHESGADSRVELVGLDRDGDLRSMRVDISMSVLIPCKESPACGSNNLRATFGHNADVTGTAPSLVILRDILMCHRTVERHPLRCPVPGECQVERPLNDGQIVAGRWSLVAGRMSTSIGRI